ncbi:MAG: hypothetical protein HQL32_13270 [Planctomycetes bacterium]|nr:hypothetical protein [Planctomycetota bacterium]
MKHIILNLSLSLAVLAYSPTFAEGTNEADSSKTVLVLSLKDTLKMLSSPSEVSTALKAISSWDEKALQNEKLSQCLLENISKENLLKRNRVEMIQFINQTMLSNQAMPVDDFAKTLLDILSNAGSPSLQLEAINTLISMEEVKGSNVKSKIEDLVVDIILDSTKSKKDSKYSSLLHGACIKAAGEKYSSSKVISTLSTLIKNTNKISAPLRISLFTAIGQLVAADDEKALDKAQRIAFLKALLESVEKNPARLPLPAGEAEKKSLLASLIPLRYLLAHNDGVSYREKGSNLMLKLLSHENYEVVKLAGAALVEINTKAKGKNTINLVDELIKILSAKKADKKQKLNSQKEVYLTTMLVQLQAAMLFDKDDTSRTNVTKILNYALKTIRTNVVAREIAIDAFYNLNPSLIKNKKLSAGSLTAVNAFFKDSLSFMNDKEARNKYPTFLSKISEVLLELTGNDFGTDERLWNEWSRKDGKSFFK